MRLLFLSQYFPPETGAGATRAESLRRYLTEPGWEIDADREITDKYYVVKNLIFRDK